MLIPFLLSFPLALLAPAHGSPAHAERDPEGSDIYLELGDVSALLTELDKAPLVRFLRDERIAGLLAELGHPTNRPLKELVEDGLRSVCSGGKPEEWLPGLKTVSASIVALGPGSKTAPPAALLAVLDFATPEQAQALRSDLIARAPKHEAMSGAVPGVELLHMGEESKDDVWCLATGPRLVIGDPPSKPEDYLARVEKKAAGFAASETFKKNVAAFEKPSGTPVLWFALASPFRTIVAKMQEADEVALDAVSQLPSDLNPFGSALFARTQFVGERFLTEMITSAAASASKPIDPAWLEPVPAGTRLSFSSAFDGAATGKRPRAVSGEGGEGAASLAALEQKLGFGFERMFGHLGPGMTVYAG